MTDHAPTRGDTHAELEQARVAFRTLVEDSAPDELAQPSNGTRWTNRELLLHMLFGYLIVRSLRIVVKVMARAPGPLQRGFANALDAAMRPFDVINHWGSRLGGRVTSPDAMVRWSDRVIASLHRKLDAESAESLRRTMAFPTRWDPYFASRMSLADVYHYATLHFAHHRRQLTLADR